MAYLNWQEKIDEELTHAQIARSLGNEGKARVCARRAAGIAIGVYINKNHLQDPGQSVIDRLNYLHSLPNISSATRQSIEYLTQRVNEDYKLPKDVDLIEEAQKLITTLLTD